MTRRPVVLQPGPSIVSPVLGGLVGTILFVALMSAAPIWIGYPVDVLRTIGGVFTSHSSAALAAGAIVTVVFGVAAWPSLVFLGWSHLPGGRVSLFGALVKGIASGVVLWVVFGVVLWIATALTRLPAPAAAGAFAARGGAAAIVTFFLASVLYGVAIAAVGAMENAISTVDALGWDDYYHAATGSLDYGAHRSTPDSIPEARRHE